MDIRLSNFMWLFSTYPQWILLLFVLFADPYTVNHKHMAFYFTCEPGNLMVTQKSLPFHTKRSRMKRHKTRVFTLVQTPVTRKTSSHRSNSSQGPLPFSVVNSVKLFICLARHEVRADCATYVTDHVDCKQLIA